MFNILIIFEFASIYPTRTLPILIRRLKLPYNSESCGSCSVVHTEIKGNNRSTLPYFIKQPAVLPKQRQQETNPSLPPCTSRLSLNIYRQRAHSRLIKDYLAENPVYDDVCFRKSFRMRKHLFLRIVEALGNHSKYFRQRHDDDGRCRYSPLMKCTAAMRILAYGLESDVLEDYLQLGDNTTVECIREFAEGVVDVFAEQYLRRPNEEDIALLLAAGKARGFTGMMGSINCMHWEWDDCPRVWRRVGVQKIKKGKIRH